MQRVLRCFWLHVVQAEQNMTSDINQATILPQWKKANRSNEMKRSSGERMEGENAVSKFSKGTQATGHERHAGSTPETTNHCVLLECV